ncbi:MAG: lipid A phosphoethanolamine transferase, partial [Muribaculaceae bacterium]|nr:lipid A phosphoethanolamine transferase [Muribaculaceae bacterium]
MNRYGRAIRRFFDNINILAVIFPLLMIVPNILLDITESISVMAKVVNIIVPLSLYYLLMSVRKNAGVTILWLIIFMVMNGFQIVVLYLFGESIIAIDMLINCVTTDSSEAGELLSNLMLPMVISAMLYLPVIVWGVYSAARRLKTSEKFRKMSRRYGLVGLAAGIVLSSMTLLMSESFNPARHIYPLNVVSNIVTALHRTYQSANYHATSEGFSYDAVDTHTESQDEIYVLVIGETSRAVNWELFGYERPTNPRLSKRSDLITFPRAVSQSNTTHKCVPMMLTHTTPLSFDSIMYRKSIIAAFKEAGYRTAVFSNQAKNHSYTQYFSEEADVVKYLEGDQHYDHNLVGLLRQNLSENKGRKRFVILHTYGSHFNYNERYPREMSYFKPDDATQANIRHRSQLLNAYDNAIRYTDGVLDDIIAELDAMGTKAVMIYTSDHGEDIFDDERGRFLHASPVPTYYQLHVPLIIWTSKEYDNAYPEMRQNLSANKDLYVAPSQSVFHTLLQMSGVDTPYLDETQSMASFDYISPAPLYLNDYNEG